MGWSGLGSAGAGGSTGGKKANGKLPSYGKRRRTRRRKESTRVE